MYIYMCISIYIYIYYRIVTIISYSARLDEVFSKVSENQLRWARSGRTCRAARGHTDIFTKFFEHSVAPSIPIHNENLNECILAPLPSPRHLLASARQPDVEIRMFVFGSTVRF